MKRLFECSITFYCIHGVNLMREKFFLSSISWETIDWWTEATSSWNTGLWLVRSNNSIWTLIKVIIADYYWLPATYYRINLAPDQRIYLPIQISMIYLLSALHSSPHPWVCHHILYMLITFSLLSSVGSSFFSVLFRLLFRFSVVISTWAWAQRWAWVLVLWCDVLCGSANASKFQQPQNMNSDFLVPLKLSTIIKTLKTFNYFQQTWDYNPKFYYFVTKTCIIYIEDI